MTATTFADPRPAHHAETATADVIISGGGLIGQTLALALAAHELTSIVIDPAPPASQQGIGFDGRASAIASASWRMLEAIGLAEDLRPHACAIDRIWVSDQLEPGELSFEPKSDDGALGYMLENFRLRAKLAEAVAAEPRIDLRAPNRRTAMERDAHGVTLTLADGARVRAPLLIVAEGRRSPTREELGIGAARWGYHHEAIVGAIAHELPHEGTAYEIFYPAGPFALLPLNDLAEGEAPYSHRCAFVWSMREGDAAAYLKLGKRGFAHELQQRMGGIFGDIAEIAPRSMYPLSFHHAGRMIDDRVVLVGDAAHGIHPIAGQGFNLGLRDVATLVEVLVEGDRLGLDLGDAQLLKRYDRWRGIDALSVSAATDTLTRLFGVPGRAASAVRRFGLGLVQRSDMARRFFMQEARGELGDLPKLLQGLRV